MGIQLKKKPILKVVIRHIGIRARQLGEHSTLSVKLLCQILEESELTDEERVWAVTQLKRILRTIDTLDFHGTYGVIKDETAALDPPKPRKPRRGILRPIDKSTQKLM